MQILPEGFEYSRVFAEAIAVAIYSAVAMISIGPVGILLVVVLLVAYFAVKETLSLFYLLMAITPITMWLLTEYSTIISFALGLSLVFLWLIKRIIIKEEFSSFPFPLIGFIVAFLFSVTVSAMNNGIEMVELKVLARFPIFFMVVLVVYDRLKPRDIKYLVYALTAPMLISAYYLFHVFFSAHGILGWLTMFRSKPGGIFDSANAFGATIMFVLPIWITLGINARKKHVKAIIAVLSILLAVSLLLTNSRAAIFGFLLSLLVIAYWKGALKKLIVFFAIVSLPLVLSPGVRDIVSVGFRVERGTSSRSEIWENTLDLVRKNPILGIGTGNFPQTYDPYFPTAFQRSFVRSVPNAHNLILNKTVELGFSGLFLILFLYYYPLKVGLRALKKASSNQDKTLIVGLVATLIGIYGRSFFEAGGILSQGRLDGDLVFWAYFITLLKISRDPRDKLDRIFT